MTEKLEGFGPYQVDYSLRPNLGEEQPIGAAAWADWDQQGRLVLAREGRLWRWQPAERLAEIEDFNDQLPDPAPAPAWTRTWPARPG